MLYIIIGILAFIVIVWLAYNMTTKGFIRGIAKTNLHTFLTLKNRYPDKSSEELYIEMIKLRPTYNEKVAKEIVEKAKESVAKAGSLGSFLDEEEGKELKLWIVILELAIHEYQELNPPSSPLEMEIRKMTRFAQKINRMKKELLDIVPIHL